MIDRRSTYHLECVGCGVDDEVGGVADDVGGEADVEEHVAGGEHHLAGVHGVQVAVPDGGERGDGPVHGAPGCRARCAPCRRGGTWNAIHRKMHAEECSASNVTCMETRAPARDIKLCVNETRWQ
jgi:hypothetical protein